MFFRFFHKLNNGELVDSQNLYINFLKIYIKLFCQTLIYFQEIIYNFEKKNNIMKIVRIFYQRFRTIV